MLRERLQTILPWIATLGTAGLVSMASFGAYRAFNPLNAAPVQLLESIPLSQVTAQAQAQNQDKSGSYWLNRKTGVYHRLGCRWYRTTAEGQFVSQQDALRFGRPCRVCTMSRKSGSKRPLRKGKAVILQ